MLFIKPWALVVNRRHAYRFALALSLFSLFGPLAASAAVVTLAPGVYTPSQLDAALSGGLSDHTEVRFQAGSYRFRNFASRGRVFSVEDLDSVSFSGAGETRTEITVEDIQSDFIYLLRSSNISIDGFTVRRSPIPFTQGRVISINGNTLLVRQQTGSGFEDFDTVGLFTQNSSGTPIANVEASFMIPADLRRIKYNTRNSYKLVNISQVGGSSTDFRFEFSSSTPINSALIDVNDGFILRNLTLANVVQSEQSREVSIADVTTMETPGAIYFGHFNEALRIDNVSTEYGPGQWTTGNGDGIHFASTRGTASNPSIIVENSHLQGLGDDNITIWNRVLTIETFPSGPTNQLELDFSLSRVGDTVLFFRPSDGQFLGRRTIVASNANGCTQFSQCPSIVYTFNSNIPNISVNNALVYNEALDSLYFEVTNNTLAYGRRSAFRIRGGYGTVAYNDVARFGGRGFETSTAAAGFSPRLGGFNHAGFRLHNTKIHDNTFSRMLTAETSDPSVILIKTNKSGGARSDFRWNYRNTIEDNYFEHYDGAMIRLESTSETVIKDNTADNLNGSFQRANGLKTIIREVNASRTILDGNDFRPDNRAHDFCIYSTDTSGAVSITERNNNRFPSSCATFRN
jgi:hypothetical protein